MEVKSCNVNWKVFGVFGVIIGLNKNFFNTTPPIKIEEENNIKLTILTALTCKL
jgi:hypothetical protein